MSEAEPEKYTNYEFGPDEIGLDEYKLDPKRNIEEDIKNGTYPTPTYLREQQIKYGEVPRKNDVDQSPFACRRRKDELFNLQSYAEKDTFVKNIAANYPKPNDTWTQFANVLFKKCNSTLDKVRAAFLFIGSVNPNSKLEDSSAVQGEVYDMVRKIQKESIHADIFERLMDNCEITYKTIFGMKKGTNYKIGHRIAKEFQRDKWFVCFIDGEWRFVDPRWGSTSVANFSHGDYNEVNVECGDISIDQSSKGQQIYEINEFYFLTNPEEFIQKCFPANEYKEWQLLVRSMTEDEFLKYPVYEMDKIDTIQVELVNYPLNSIAVPHSGEIKIHLREIGELKEHQIKLHIHENSTNEYSKKKIKEKAKDENLLKFLRQSRNGSDIIVTFTPPCEGKYMIQFYVKIIDKIEQVEDGTITHFKVMQYLEYAVHCPQTNKYTKALPETDSKLQEFGVGATASQQGLTTETPGEVMAEDGEGKITFESNLIENFKYSLYDDQSEENINNILHWTEKHENVVQVMTNDRGQYILVVKKENGDPICQFLINADSEIQDVNFEMPDIENYGGLGFVNANNTIAAPESASSPYIRTDNSELNIMWNYPQEMELKCEMLCSENKELIDNSLYTQVQYDNRNKKGNVKIRFPKPGNYLLKLLSNKDGVTVHIFNYLIRYTGYEDVVPTIFPVTLNKWNSSSMTLIEPTTGVIPVNKEVHFKAKLDNNDKNVFLTSEKSLVNVQLICNNNDGIYSTTIPANSFEEGDKIKLVSKDTGSQTEDELLEFYLEDFKYRTTKEKKENELKETNQQRKGEERERKKKQENTKRMRQGLQPLTEEEMKRNEKERLEKQRLETERTNLEQQKIMEERKRKQEEALRQEQQRLEEEKRRNERERIEKEKRKKQERKEDERKEQELIEEEQRRERERKEEEERKERERIEQKRQIEQHKQEQREKEQREATLVEAIRSKIISALKTILEEMKKHNDNQDNRQVKLQMKYAEDLLDSLQLKRKLTRQIKNYKKTHNIGPVKTTVEAIDKEFMSSSLAVEILDDVVEEAKQLIKKEDKLNRKVVHTLNPDANALQELRSYTNPRKEIHEAVQSMLLLCGYYEKQTRKWSRCQPLLNNLENITRISPDDVEPEIAARAEEILHQIDRRQIAQMSAAGLAFFDWTTKMIKEVSELWIKDGVLAHRYRPAKIKRQKKLLKVSREEDADYDWEDKGIRR